MEILKQIYEYVQGVVFISELHHVLLAGIIPAFFIAPIEAYVDQYMSKKKIIEHSFSAFIRVLVASAFCFISVDVVGYFPIYFKGALFVFMLLMYWVTFDPLFNLFKRGYDEMFVIPEPHDNSAVTDRLAFKWFGKNGMLYMRTKVSISFFFFILCHLFMTL